MSEGQDLIVRNMTQDECRLAVEWAAREGWNPGMKDAECFYAADPKGFFIALLNGEPAGCLSAVAYDDHFGFAGLYMVKEEMRHQGIGHKLIEQASAYMGSRTVGNDAVVTQQETYRKYGFQLAYRNIRYCGIASSAVMHDPEIQDLRDMPFSRLAAYDRVMFPAERTAFLRCWIGQNEGAALGCMKHGKLSGYGVIRKCRRGYKIGPLFADDEEIADRLFRSLTGKIRGDEFFFDIPEPNPGARALIQRYGMNMVFETARMYSGPVPSLPLEKIFGVTSFELG